MALFPRYHLFEIGDQRWCPGWLLAYLQSYLTHIWTLHIPGFNRTSPADVACSIINRNLPDVSSFTFVDLCAGAGGPIPVLDSTLNKSFQAKGKSPAQFILSDLHPHLKEWQAIAKNHDNISYINHPLDATKCERLTPHERKECRIFNLCFHHFPDKEASAILGSALDSADAFIIFEFASRNLSSLLNIPIIFLSALIFTPLRFWFSPSCWLFTYFIPIMPLMLAFDGFISTLRMRTPKEIDSLLSSHCHRDGWEFTSGDEIVIRPFLSVYWYIGVRKST